MKETKLPRLASYIILGISLLAITIFLWYFKNIMAYILISVVVSLIGSPVMRNLTKLRLWNKRLPSAVAAGITLGLMFTIGFVVMRLIIPLFIAEAEMLSQVDLNKAAEHLEVVFGQFKTTLEHLITSRGQRIEINNFFVTKLEAFLNYANVSTAVNVLVQIFGNIFIAVFAVLFISFFFLKEPNLFLNSILMVMPDEHVERTKAVMKSTKKLLTRYFIGLMIECTLTMILVTSGLLLIGVSFQQAAVIGFVSGTFNIIPYIGPFIACSFGAAMGIAEAIELDTISLMIPAVIANATVIAGVFFFNAIVTQPFIHSNSVKAHPLEIFLVILMAGSLAGVPGMILAIPSYTLFRVIAKEFFNKGKVIQELTKNI